MRGVSRLLALLALLCALLLTASSAQASPDLEVGIADDAVFIHTPHNAPGIVRRWKSMGIDTARVMARWVAIAPRPHARRPPRGFNATDHRDQRYNWHTLDLAVDLLRSNGIRPIVTITGSGPLWSSLTPSRGNHRWKPDPAQFGAFATAVARRYVGRVHRYIIWNEPNQAGWLQPQFSCRGGHCKPFAPHHYRRLYRAARRAIKATDRTAEVLIGALAPRGGSPTRRNAPMRPLSFLRALGCVSRHYVRINSQGCRRQGPLRTEGVAYHPHGVLRAPDQPSPNPNEAAMADLPRLLRAIDHTVARGILRPTGGKRRLDLYLTEFSYQTNPPDKAVGVSPAQQARWLAQASYIAWRNPRVRNISHYEWRDEKVSRKSATGTRAFASWQSGLFYVDGTPKPALAVFPHPIWAVPRSDGLVKLWGQVRPGAGASNVRVMRRLRGTVGAWEPIADLRSDAHGFWTTTVHASQAAVDYRFAYVLQSEVAGAARSAQRFSQPLDPQARRSMRPASPTASRRHVRAGRHR